MKKNYFLLVLFLSMTCLIAKGQWTTYNGSMVPDEHPIEFDVSNAHNLNDQEFADLHWVSDGMLGFLLEPDFDAFPDPNGGQRGMWRHQWDAPATEATFILKVKGLSDTLDWVMDFDIHFGGYREQVQIQTDNTIDFNRGDGGTVNLPAGFSTQDWHTYRITVNAADSSTAVYLDGVDTAFATSTTAETSGNDYFRFVSGDRNKSIGFELDYVTWNTTGAYSPVDEANPLASPSGYNIAFIEDADREPNQIEFLESQGFNVNVLEVVQLASADQSYIDALNLADLVIIGRSPGSTNYRDADAEAWKDITSPVILNAQYVAQNGPERINWFETGSAFHADEEPDTAYATVANPNDTIFSFVNVGDSIPWTYAPHDMLELDDTATNGNVAARWMEDNVFIVQNEANAALYDGGPSAAGSRTYFGFGNDNAGYDNFFPLTNEAQQVYYNEISRLLGIGMSEVEPVDWTREPANIVLIQDEDERDAQQEEFLIANGFDVTVVHTVPLSTANQTFIDDTLNAADLVIIGRSPNSGEYRDADAEAWKDVTSPVILNAQYIAHEGPGRIDWFEASGAFHADEEPDTAYATVSDPNDTIFTFVNVGDSIPWMFAPHDLLAVGDTATNGNIAANWQGDNVLIVQNEADSALYEGGPSAAGPRTYFGFGNDNVGWANFFPLTNEAQQVYYNEIQRLLDRPMKEVTPVVPSMEPANIVLIQDEDERDARQEEFLVANGFDVTVVHTVPLGSANQTFIDDTLNAADLVIIGRSPNSGEYRDADAEAWKDVTSPVILNAQYIAQNGAERINWFEAASAYHADVDPEVAYAQVADPNDPIFSFVTFTDSIPWMYAPHDLLTLDDTATNGNIAATFRDMDALIVQNEADSALYEGGPTAAGARTYFGFGNDNNDWANFFPLTDEAQQVYYNEIQRLLGRPMKEVTTVDTTGAPPETVEFTVALSAEPAEGGSVSGDGTYEEGTEVTVEATANDDYAFVNWTEDGTEVSTDASYTFTIEADRDLVANFEEDGVGILNPSANTVITMYPNPASSTVQIDGLEASSTITVMNAVGQVVTTYDKVISGDQLDISNLENGLYILRIETEGEVIGNMRLIKQ